MEVTPVESFQIATDITGKAHTISVRVFSSRPALLEYLTAAFPAGNWDHVNEAGESASAAFISAGGFVTNKAPKNLGTIYYSKDHLDIGTVVHEVVHAASFIYQCDILGVHSRAMAHLNSTNETLAYLIDRMMAAVAEELFSRGLYDDVVPIPTEEQR